MSHADNDILDIMEEYIRNIHGVVQRQENIINEMQDRIQENENNIQRLQWRLDHAGLSVEEIVTPRRDTSPTSSPVQPSAVTRSPSPIPPVSPPPPPIPGPADNNMIERVDHIKEVQDKILTRMNDLECQKSIVISHIPIMEELQSRNNQHLLPGQMVPAIKRALCKLSLEDLTDANHYKLNPATGALKLTYDSPLEARRKLVCLRSIVGRLKKNSREHHETRDHAVLFRMDQRYRIACSMKFSAVIPHRFRLSRSLYQKAAKILKGNGQIQWWECITIQDKLVMKMKTFDRTSPFKYMTEEEANEIVGREQGGADVHGPGAGERNQIEE